jgi:hypothetical protein
VASSPHLVKPFKLSDDPAFQEKLTDGRGALLEPAQRAGVMYMDEKGSVPALEATAPSLPMKRAGQAR